MVLVKKVGEMKVIRIRIRKREKDCLNRVIEEGRRDESSEDGKKKGREGLGEWCW